MSFFLFPPYQDARLGSHGAASADESETLFKKNPRRTQRPSGKMHTKAS